jgi:hypothetical protein
VEGWAREIRTILAAVSGGGGADAGVVERACSLARRFGSHLEGYHVRLDPRELGFIGADGFGTALTGDLVELEVRDAADAAIVAHRRFDAAVTRYPPPVSAAVAWCRSRGVAKRLPVGARRPVTAPPGLPTGRDFTIFWRCAAPAGGRRAARTALLHSVARGPGARARLAGGGPAPDRA